MSCSKTVLVYGPTGSGKTRLIPTAPKPFVISTDAGLVSLKKWQIPFVNVKNAKEFSEALKWVRSPQAKEFETICIDDLTELADLILAEEKPKHKNLMQAYGKMGETVMGFMRELRDIGNESNHFIYMICKQDKVKDQGTGGLIYGPMFPGQMISPMVPYIFDELYHLNSTIDDQQQFVNWLRTKRDPQFEAKSRSDVLDLWEPANLTHIFTKISQG